MELPAPLPKALENPAPPEVEVSPALSLMARPGDGGIRTRKVAVLVAHGVEGASLGKLVSALVAAGAVPRLVGARLGTYVGAGGEKFAADATMENSPGFLFDALVLPDGAGAVEALDADAHTLEFLRAQYWHCKTILAFGASQALLAEAQIPMTLPDGARDTGLILADAAGADEAIAEFIAAMGMHRHFGPGKRPAGGVEGPFCLRVDRGHFRFSRRLGLGPRGADLAANRAAVGLFAGPGFDKRHKRRQGPGGGQRKRTADARKERPLHDLEVRLLEGSVQTHRRAQRQHARRSSAWAPR